MPLWPPHDGTHHRWGPSHSTEMADSAGRCLQGGLWVRNYLLTTFQVSPGGVIRGAQEALRSAQLHVGPAAHVVASAAGKELLATWLRRGRGMLSCVGAASAAKRSLWRHHPWLLRFP